jgi:hypothetical protein
MVYLSRLRSMSRHLSLVLETGSFQGFGDLLIARRPTIWISGYARNSTASAAAVTSAIDRRLAHETRNGFLFIPTRLSGGWPNASTKLLFLITVFFA